MAIPLQYAHHIILSHRGMLYKNQQRPGALQHCLKNLASVFLFEQEDKLALEKSKT